MTAFALADAVPVLERTPRALRALLDGLPAAWTDATEGPDTWSPTVVVAHLLAADRDNWIPRARVFLGDAEPRVLPSFDPDAQFRDSAGVPLGELMDRFERMRAESLATLAGWRVDDAMLARTAEHPALGTVALRQLLSTWVAHDLAHIAQVARVMAKRYREAIGPWRAYLPIMDR